MPTINSFVVFQRFHIRFTAATRIGRKCFDVLRDTRLIDVGNRLIQHRPYLATIVGLIGHIGGESEFISQSLVAPRFEIPDGNCAGGLWQPLSVVFLPELDRTGFGEHGRVASQLQTQPDVVSARLWTPAA